jgi:hypothetical protein
MQPSEITQVLKFLSLARSGARRSGSSGEQAAFKLVRAAENISSLMQDMDMENQEAFCNLLKGLAWPDSRDILLKTVRAI